MSLRSSLRTEGISVRSIFTFALVVIITALLWATFGTSTPTHAADATWDGASLSHEGRQYLSVGESSGEESHNIPEGSIYYVSIEEITADDENTNPRTAHKAHVIYFAPGADPPVESSATYVNYDYDIDTRNFSAPSATQTVTIDTASSDIEPTSCAIEGVGWIVCSLSTFLAEGMDFIFGVLTGFMEVQPINVSNTDGDLYIAWDIMRNIANVAFIIAFTIIIYSQLTSFGISNYGLKKLLPRLIISAVLVNLSFIVSAIAVDISNIFGYSLQDIFMQIRNDTFGIDESTWSESVTDWKAVTAVVLSGGTAAAVGIGSLVVSAGGTITGAIFIILPALLGLLLTALVVILILAARQAIIIILVIIAPLAFVAYLLPNTEKWFDKWKDVFMTMLIFFPAFSVVFGGSQLAGAVIIQNASSLIIVILGMIVQVAPLVITPLILKFSGSLLGKIAGIVNNPNKGLLDRTRKWADGRREHSRMRGISGMQLNGKPGELRKRNVARNLARRSEQRRRNLEAKTKNASAHMDNEYQKTDAHRKINKNAHEIGMNKEIIEAGISADINRGINQRGGRFYAKNLELESAKTDADVEKIRTQKITDEYKSGQVTIDTPPSDASTSEKKEAAKLKEMSVKMGRNSIELAAETRAGVAAKQAQQQNYAEALKIDPQIKAMAAGIDPSGEQRALADAISIINKNRNEAIENAKVIIDYNNLDEGDKIKLIGGKDTSTIKATADMIMAAQSLLKSSSPVTVLKAIEEADYTTRTDLSAADLEDIYANLGATIGDPGNKLRPAFFDFGTAGKMKQGLDMNGDPISGPIGEAGMNELVIRAVNGKKALSPDSLQGMFPPYIDVVVRAVKANRGSIDPDAAQNLRETLDTLLDPSRPGYDRLTGEAKDKYKDLRSSI